ncbi:MAG: hypothetical protein AB1457_09155 [Chloroflexota bacterium]
MAKRILLIGGSLNQTMMMHKIAQALPEHECVFTPFYAEGLMGWAARQGLLDFTILGGRHRRETEDYLQCHQLPVDFGGQRGGYDLVVTCTDLIIQGNIRKTPIVLVQEGMTEPEGLRYQNELPGERRKFSLIHAHLLRSMSEHQRLFYGMELPR